MIAFGIDPGSYRTGWGVVVANGSRLSCRGFGVISAPQGVALQDRLATIFEGLSECLRLKQPDVVFLESIFHHRSAKSALVLGHARGVALLAAGQGAHALGELTPAEIKKSVTGSGRADKQQVQEMVRILLGLETKAPPDAADALALAIAGAMHAKWTALKKKPGLSGQRVGGLS